MKDASATALNLSWLPPLLSGQNGVITMYRVRWNKTEFGNWEDVRNVTATQTQMHLTHLEEYVEYDVQVQAFTSVGPGPFSAPIRKRTLAGETSRYG